jgi:uncharacterized membrane protein (TIGR02234 family)
MTSGAARPVRPGSAGRALAVTLLLGAAGAGIAFLATRQDWAQVRTAPPRPLPASTVHVTGAALVPYADALVVAGLASLAAVLATRRAWRRISGLALAALGAALAASAVAVSAAAAIVAAAGAVGPASNPGAGSVTEGSATISGVPNVAGATPHAELTAAGWQALVILGAIAMIAAGLQVAVRPARLAVMSSRYDAPPGSRAASPAGARHSAASGGQEPAGQQAEGRAPDSASVWEALSRGDDPTASVPMSGGPMSGGPTSGGPTAGGPMAAGA